MILSTIALLAAMGAQTAPSAPVPPKPPLVHGYVWFESGTVRRNPGEIDPVEYLGSRVPSGAYVWVEGKTDTVGDPGSNMTLSRARALVVADALVRTGVDPAVITVVACGENAPIKATADGVAEPLNRFVQFDWNAEARTAFAPGCVAEPYRR
jgi:hypothetical protein